MILYFFKVFSFFTIFLAEKVVGFKNGQCSNSSIEISVENSYALLMPTNNETYYPDMNCQWQVHINYSTKDSSILKIEPYILLRNGDRLTITSCATKYLYYDSSNESHQNIPLYLQEDEICVHFNSTSENFANGRRFFWSTRYLLTSAPIDIQVFIV